MKKVTFYLICLLMIFSGLRIKAQISTQRFDPKQFVYWFYIKAESKIDKEHKRPVYVVRTLSKTPKSGTISVYEKDVWRNLQSGQQIVIGPFVDYETARRAIEAYDLAKLTKDRMEQGVKAFKEKEQTAEDFYWYFLKFSITQRTHSIVFDRTAAAVANGGLSDFLTVFLEGVTFEQLAVGPFATQIEAEESKRLNRLEEK
jgi:hypothetical protein